MSIPSAPEELSSSSRTLWDAIMAEYELSAAEVEVLRQALLALDRAEQARVVVDREGVTCLDRFGSPKQHPAVDVEARNRLIYAKLVAQLGVRATRQTTRRRVGAPGGRRPAYPAPARVL
jgi:hypothetical protein